jgi:predicted dehydrogenase
MRHPDLTRRRFLRRSIATAAVLGAAASDRVLGANDRIRVGLIGAGNRGQGLWEDFLAQPDVSAVSICDVHPPHLEKAAAMSKTPVSKHGDFRRVLEDGHIDAVIVATPDHWHALQTIMACEAGKDVYVEKPLSLRIAEGRRMVNAARKHGRVVQTGSQQRSGAHYARAVELVRAGRIGTVSHVSAGFVRNAMPGYLAERISRPPEGLDWEMWLGPAPYRASLPLNPLYHFRWFWDYSGGQMTNFGAHDLDIVRWVMNVRAPTHVASFGGRYVVKDGGETPDVQEVIYRFPDLVVNWSVREMNGRGSGMFMDFHGTKGTLSLTRRGFEVFPEGWSLSEEPKQPRCEAVKDPGSEQGKSHVRNFLDCVKSRARPNADVEEGHLTATCCHLGNIALRTGKLLQWDAEQERIVGDSEANAWLQYEYRRPWKLE